MVRELFSLSLSFSLSHSHTLAKSERESSSLSRLTLFALALTCEAAEMKRSEERGSRIRQAHTTDQPASQPAAAQTGGESKNGNAIARARPKADDTGNQSVRGAQTRWSLIPHRCGILFGVERKCNVR